MGRFSLWALLIIQAVTHLFWLSPSAHSGQLAIPWMMNRGMRLFGNIWEQHAPGSSLLGALAQSLIPLHPGLVIKLLNTVLVIAITVMVYQLARQLAGKASAGILAAAVWAWWEPVYGNVMLYFDTLLAGSILAALLIYCRRCGRPTGGQIILTGLLMGLATLFKQQAWLAVGLLGIWLLVCHRSWRIGLMYGLAALLLPLIQWGALFSQGLLEGYLYWNWTYNLAGTMDGVALNGDLFRKLLLSNLLVFPFAFIAFVRREGRRGLLLLMWLAGLTVLYPRFGEIHGMGHLPFAAVMSGVVLAWLCPSMANWRAWDLPRAALVGLGFGVGLGWLWTGAVSYIPTSMGRNAILAYDEFAGLVDEWRPHIAPGDTLFVLPETDSTPQLHPLTGMMPPGTWVKGWRWYFRPDFVLSTLTREWDSDAPDWIVVFPDYIPAAQPGVQVLLDIVERRYRLVFTRADIFGHGRAEVYRLERQADD